MSYFRFVTNYRQNPPRPTLEESLWRVRANETPLGPSWSDWSNELHARKHGTVIDVVRNMSPTVFTDTDLNCYRSDPQPWIEPCPECGGREDDCETCDGVGRTAVTYQCGRPEPRKLQEWSC